MVITSITFYTFLLLVFILYWFVFNQNLSGQNLVLLFSSYIFYGWWDWRFLTLLIIISLCNFFIAIGIQERRTKKYKKLFFITGLILNIGTLLFFKYFNFFIDGFISLISLFGFRVEFRVINIILPIGISFYIFLCISYIIDIYQNKLVAVKNILSVLLSLSFFPIILAGPIHRPISLLAQIQTKRIFNYAQAVDGLKQILYGVFMKSVIADNCAITVDTIFADSSKYSGSTLMIANFLFTIQIYADFAGYSNIAIGVGKQLGFNIVRNFDFPYFARDIREFWRKWNISLTTWFRDYVFLPLAYSISRSIESNRFYLIKTEFVIYSVGIIITWILTGLWHGAKYTFIVWGLFHAAFLITNHILLKPRKRLLKRLNVLNDNTILIIIDTVVTFFIIMLSWIFFRADDVEHAFTYISRMFSNSFFDNSNISRISRSTLFIVVSFSIIEWLGRKHEYAIAHFGLKWPWFLRWLMYVFIVIIIVLFGGREQQFIYFKF